MLNEHDYTRMLEDWPHEPGRLSARLVEDDRGVSRIQVRVELGILQMELTGRPDGRPAIYEGLGSPGGQHLPPVLGGDECRELQHEAAMYAYRMLVCSSLQLHDRVIVDSIRNLGVMEFIIACASSSADRASARQLRVQLLLFRIRAEAGRIPSERLATTGRDILERGIEEVKEAIREAGKVEDPERAPELAILRRMRDALVPRLPSSQRHETELRLKAALDVENYELAAILSDELRQLF